MIVPGESSYSFINMNGEIAEEICNYMNFILMAPPNNFRLRPRVKRYAIIGKMRVPSLDFLLLTFLDFGIAGATTLILSFAFYMPVGFMGAYGAVRLNDSVGRRPLQAIGFGSMAIAMLLFYLASLTVGSLLIGVGLLAFILDYGMGNLGPGNTMGLYAIELLPTKLRSSSMGNATGITRIVSFLSAFLFPLVSDSLGKSTFFVILLVLMVVAFLFTILFTPETKGLTLEEIAIASYKRINGKVLRLILLKTLLPVFSLQAVR